jgi:hypothetical protein
LCRLHRIIPADQDKFFLTVELYASDENVEDHYPITHAKNSGMFLCYQGPCPKERNADTLIDCDLWEEVTFEIDMVQLRDKLPLLSKQRSPRPRGHKDNSTPSTEPLQRSGRKRKSSGKRDRQLQDTLLSGASVTQSNHERQRNLRSQPIVTEDEATQDPAQQYVWVNYIFAIQFDDLLAKYTMYCPDADTSIEGSINLVPIFDPGTV